MKILVVASTLPNIKNEATVTANNFFNALRKRMPCDEVWAVYKPGKFTQQIKQDRRVIDIHDFDEAASLLKDVGPDCIINNGNGIMSVSMHIAARHLGIPTFMISNQTTDLAMPLPKKTTIYHLRKMLLMFFSNMVPSDMSGDRQFMRRGRFITYKMKFLHRTLHRAGSGFFTSWMTPLKETVMMGLSKDGHYKRPADYYFVSDNLRVPELARIGIDTESIFIVGTSIWENLAAKCDQKFKKPDPKKMINILVITAPLYEHGFWSRKERSDFITTLVSGLQKDLGIKISFKIHPSSEDMQEYTDILKGFDKIQIYQSEEISDIAPDFDVAVSFGPTAAQTEAIIIGMRLVLIKLETDYVRLVGEGIKSGIVTVCESPAQAPEAIHDCLRRDVIPSDALVAELDALLSKEKPSERMADIMLEILQKT